MSQTARFGAAGFLATVMLVAATPFVSAQTNSCGGDNGGITLPPGFCATIFADNVGHARQMVFGPGGVLYLNTWSGGYYQNDKPPDGGFLVAFKDTKGDGRADVMARFGDGVAQGSAGGTGIRIYNGGFFCRTERQDHPLFAADQWLCARGEAARHCFRPAAYW
jgi:hypothetical protein